jgi:ATP-dependent exoDNAse (exonuclease V) beta subunit
MIINQKNFIVCRASAGSGKTFKLVNEYLKLCLLSDSKFKFGKILAITFTNKAAAEMKDRIIEHLRALSANKSDKYYSQSWIEHYMELTGLSEEIIRTRAQQIRESVLHNYTSLSISTIDKFTHKLIRSFARDLRLSADFEIQLDPEETLSKSTDELISLAGQDMEVTEILENYVDYLISEGSSWQVEKGIKHFGKQILDENASLHLNKLAEMSHAEFKNIFTFLNEFIKKYELKLINLEELFFAHTHQSGLAIEHFNYASNGPFRHFNTLKKKYFDDSKLKFTDRDQEILGELSFIKIKSQSQFSSEIIAKTNQFFIQLNEILIQEHPKYIFYKLLRKNIYNLSLIKQFSNKLNEINQNENTVLIGEFNKIISDVVKNDPAPFIYERIGERYHHILIDEFQDTSVLQFNNILPLIENSLANSHKCLIVGDPKQAIYRWRGGDIDQFIQLPNLENEVSLEIKQSVQENFILEELTNNYRSGKNIVEFNNQFFQYTSASLNSEYQSIYSSLKQESKNEAGYVELTLLEEDKINGDENILNLTIEKINECKNSGFNFSDITILTRNKKEGVLIAERLYELKIPVISSESLLLSGSNEVQLTMSFIKFLAYPKDQIAGFKTIELHQKFINEEDSNVYDKYRKNDSKYLFEVQKYLADQNIIYHRSNLLNHTSYQLILEVVRLFFPQSENNYLRFLVEYVYNQWKNKPVDILELCEWWEEHKDKLSVQSTEKNDAIQIMTIHASKGLQFPVVIFPFAEWKSKNGREWLWVDLKNEEIPLKTTIVKSNATQLDQSNYSIIKTEEKNKTDLDDLNLMYVALTRPETRLYLISENVNTMKRFSPFFKQSLEQTSNIIWSKGKKEYYTSKISSIVNSFKIEYSPDKSWQDRLRLSTEKDVNKEEQEEIYLTKKSGILLHYILEKFENLNDAKAHLDLISTQNKSISKTYSSLLKEINSVYNHPFIGNLLTNKNTISECSIVDITGKTYRPDKVVLENDSVIICDFKTGAKKEEHKIQLDEYGKLFSEMKYKTIKKYLFYTKESLLLEIQ